MPNKQGPTLSPHFFRREEDGSVRLRIRFTAEEADIIEEGAGETPLLAYIHRQIMDRARHHARLAQEERQKQLGEPGED